jgi:uncharacterized protein YPO0396
MFIVADRELSIAEHFANFGADIGDLRKRLRKTTGLEEPWDSFPPYAAAFRRRFGIENEQALDLFHQTVSLKSVGNLTDFVRLHMLQPYPVEPRIHALMGHFDDLNRAHAAVLKAKTQIEQLGPLVADCERHASLVDSVEDLRVSRDALRPWFAERKCDLLQTRLRDLDAEIEKHGESIAAMRSAQATHQLRRDGLRQSISDSGGDRIAQLAAEVEQLRDQLETRRRQADRYDALARGLGLPALVDANSFVANRRLADAERDAGLAREADAQNALTEATVLFRGVRQEHAEIEQELVSLRQRRTNLPARVLAMRAQLCDALDLDERALPFAGELLQVREDERDWEGATERLLHSFGLSLLVPDAHYQAVAKWVDATHLGERLVYYRVRALRPVERTELHVDSLVHKIAVKPDSPFRDWIEAEVARRFDYACCESLDQFRRETRAITRSGQMKGRGDHHEKDDRHRIDDRSRYVLGWSNAAKIAALESQAKKTEARLQHLGGQIADLTSKRDTLRERLGKLEQLAKTFDTFRDLDWRPLALQIELLEEERRRLESESDTLRVLREQLDAVETQLAEAAKALDKANESQGGLRTKHEAVREQREELATIVAATPDAVRSHFPRVGEHVTVVLRGVALGLTNCDARERDVREALQGQLDAHAKTLSRLAEKIVQAMQAYNHANPTETKEVDASVDSAGDYRAMLSALQTDDLPRFERKFKELLNENTIREVASFQSQLNRERQSIHERIETINGSLRAIDYNPGRFIVLEPTPTNDVEIRQFQQDLRACTEGALTGSEDEAYSEAKFLHVKRIIERFRGREGHTEIDLRWTRKVTDVRNWFTFSASERWREDDREHEHYTDSGGKSGGQKEKLAYTVLAASLAYQFGLEWGASRSRTFRFVVIDEAFGRSADPSTRYGLELFERLNLQLLIVTPLQKIHVIEPHVAGVGFVHNEEGCRSMLRNLTIDEYRAERAARSA